MVEVTYDKTLYFTYEKTLILVSAETERKLSVHKTISIRQSEDILDVI